MHETSPQCTEFSAGGTVLGLHKKPTEFVGPHFKCEEVKLKGVRKFLLGHTNGDMDSNQAGGL